MRGRGTRRAGLVRFGAIATRFAAPVRAFARAAGFLLRRFGGLVRFAPFFGAARLAGLFEAARFAARARFAAGRRFGFDVDPLFFVAMLRLYIRQGGTAEQRGLRARAGTG